MVQLRQPERREANLDVSVLQIETPVLLEFLRRKNSIQKNPDRLRDFVRVPGFRSPVFSPIFPMSKSL